MNKKIQNTILSDTTKAIVSLDDLLKLCETLHPMSKLKPVYTNRTIMELLDINTTTLKKYRDQGLLGYSQVDSKFFYTAEDVYTFLRNTHSAPFGFNNFKNL